MNVKTVSYLSVAFTAFSGILNLYANVQYNLFGSLNAPISQGGGWPYPAYFTIVGIGLLVGTFSLLKGVRWAYFLGIAYVIINYILYLVGAFGTVFPASPFGVDGYGIFTQAVQTVMLVLLILTVVRKNVR